MSKNIVVMGGSFNPPTVAHERLMAAAIHELSADYGIFVPSSDSYVSRKMRRESGIVFSESERLFMLQTICKDHPKFRVSTYEYQDDGKGHTYVFFRPCIRTHLCIS